MKAFILAAGLGTRLRPLTNDRPKALVDVGGIPLLAFALHQLKYYGFRDIVVNIHHFGEQIITFLNDFADNDLQIEISDERDQLLGTGGALCRAAPLLKDGNPFLIYNADIISDLDLRHLYQHHVENGALATLAVRQRSSSRSLHFNANWALKAWSDQRNGREKGPIPTDQLPHQRAFSGIHVISPQIFDLLPPESFFSIIDLYLKHCATHLIQGYDHSHSHWLDAGKINALPEAGRLARQILTR